ncbi:MAG: site-2 protease family protein, partial [Lachnospiraceae bacterium]|nr:site-2 protease family protein [Lachnospiraceae bacterium]
GVKNTYKSLLMLVTGKLTRKDVAGPVGMAHMVGEIYEETKEDWRDVFVNMLNLTMIISVSLGIMNILPFPALDGGRLVFLIVEVFRGKPVPPEKEGLVHFVGLVFFMVLMVVVLFNDIVNIVG